MTYLQLRIAVRQAWDSVGKRQLDHPIDEMRDRCQAVIDAKGMHTKYWDKTSFLQHTWYILYG